MQISRLPNGIDSRRALFGISSELQDGQFLLFSQIFNPKYHLYKFVHWQKTIGIKRNKKNMPEIKQHKLHWHVGCSMFVKSVI